MPDTAARLALYARRYELARFTILVSGIDLTGVVMNMQVRSQRGVPGPPLIQLGTVNTLAAEGLKLDSMTVTDGVPTSIIRGRINASTMNDAAKVPYSGEFGSDTVLAYAMQWTLGGDAQTRLEGDFVVRDSAFGSDNAPADRPVSYSSASSGSTSSSGALQFGDQVVNVSIDASGQLVPLISGTKVNADRADAAADRVRVIGLQISADALAAATSRNGAQQLRDQTLLYANRGEASAIDVAQHAADVVTKANEVFASRDAVYSLAGITKTYATRAEAFAAALPANDAFVQVLVDESYGNRRTVYQNQGGTLKRVSADVAQAPRTVWMANNGNDITGDGSQARPIKSRAKLMTMVQPYDTVKFAPGTVIAENWNLDRSGNPWNDNVPLYYDCQDGVVFQQMNNLMTGWMPAGAAYPNVYYATVNHSFGALDNTFEAPGQGFGPQMLIDQTRLIDKQLAAVVDENNKYASEAEAMAAVQATPGSFYVRGKNGSNMQKGWQAGEQTYFVHCPDGTSPAGHLVNYGDRIAPYFEPGSKLWGKITVFGGIGHNGVIWRGCDVEDAEVLYPCHHAQFCVGAHLKRVWVRHGNRTHGGYPYHDFGGSGTFLDRDTLLEDCGVSDHFDASNTVFGGHGTDDAVSPYVGRQLVTRNFMAINVSSIGLRGGVQRFPAVHYDMIAIGVNTIDIGGSFAAYNLKVIANHLSPPIGPLFGGGGGGKGRIEGGYSIGASAQIGMAVGGGVDVDFVDHHILIDGDYANGRWLQTNPGGGDIRLSFERCVLEAVNTPVGALGHSCNGSTTITLKDSHFAGLELTPGGNLTVIDSGTVYGGKSGLSVGADGGLATAPNSTIRHLGFDVIDSANSFLGQSISILSSKGLFFVYSEGLFQTATAWVPPADVKLTGIGRAGNNEVIYGRAGAVFRVGRGDPTPGNVVRVNGGPNKNFTGGISGLENFFDADFFLLGDDGSITQYRPQNDAFTPRASPVAYPLRGGTYNHSTGGPMIAWGDGGVIVSTDLGVTWAQSIAQGDGTDVANMYNQVTCCGWANGQFFVWCQRGVLLTSPTGAKGSWLRQYLPLPFAYVRSMAVDQGKGLGVCVADMAGAFVPSRKFGRSQSVIRLNISDPDPSKWRIIDVIDPPLSAVSKVLHQQNVAESQNGFCFIGKVVQAAQSDTGQSGRVSGRPVGFVQPQFTGHRDRERTKAVQPTG